MGGAFSPIHLLSIWTLFSLVMAARQGDIRLHKIWMVLLYILALKVTGVFTLLPGRVMHGALFGVQYPCKGLSSAPACAEPIKEAQ